MDKSPEALLRRIDSDYSDSLYRRIDPDYYYPTYGDDSTVTEDAPTSGKFYVKLKKDETYGLWGNYTIRYYDTD